MTGGERYPEIITILAGAIVRHKIYQHNKLNRVTTVRLIVEQIQLYFVICIGFQPECVCDYR